MNQIHPKKLLNSKWTAVMPHNREKHFVVTKMWWDAPNKLGNVELEAIMTGNHTVIHWRALKDSSQWRVGWH